LLIQNSVFWAQAVAVISAAAPTAAIVYKTDLLFMLVAILLCYERNGRRDILRPNG
jgi:hypothetical protein